MPSSSDEWFVQMDLGMLLGPMPKAELLELVQTGALLERDQIRKGTVGNWQPASDVPGLFNVAEPSDEPSEPLTDTASSKRSVDTATSRNASSSRKRVIAAVTPADVPLATSPDDLLSRPARPRSVSVADESDDLGFEVDVPLLDPSEWEAATSVIERVDDSTTNDVTPPPRFSPIETAAVHSLLLADEPASPPEPPPFAVLPPRAESPTPPPFRRPSIEAFAPQRDRLAGIVRVLTLTAVAGLVTAAVWWFWPGQEPDIYASYTVIYRECQERRDGTQGPAGWDEFAARSKARIDTSLEWLKTHAHPGDREASLLLYAGRDLREILDHPHDYKSPHQRRLDGLFSRLNQIYAPSK